MVFHLPPSAHQFSFFIPFLLINYLKYSRVAPDEPDAEAGDVHQHSDNVPLNPRPVDGQPHVHCEVCDRQMDRREKAKHREYKCQVVSRTFILITLFMMIFGIVAVTTVHKKHR
jgi:hypothetical protein